MIISAEKWVKVPSHKIYFLFKDGELIYVGRSGINLGARLSVHKTNGKVWDECWSAPIEEEDYKETEAFYINLYSPRCNHLKREIRMRKYHHIWDGIGAHTAKMMFGKSTWPYNRKDNRKHDKFQYPSLPFMYNPN